MENIEDMLDLLAEKIEEMSPEEFFEIYDSVDVVEEEIESARRIVNVLKKLGIMVNK